MSNRPFPRRMGQPETDAIHGGKRPDPLHGAIAEPLVLSSNFEYPEKTDGSPATHIYTRYANPTIEAVERRMAVLEETEQAAMFASGMAAIAGALLASLRSGDGVLATPERYGGTDELFTKGLERFGVTVDTLERSVLDDPDRLVRHVQPHHKVFYLESPTNPMLRVLDVPALVAAAKDAGLTVIIDNTFAGPLLARPARWGADLVCESATKTLGGHSDLIAGIVAGPAGPLDDVKEVRKVWGSSADPSTAYRLLRGIPTLPVRLERSGRTAVRLAEALSDRPWVETVHHPSLPDHPDHDIAQRTLDGPLPLVTISLRGGEDAARRLRRHIRVIRGAPSLGGVESLVSLPSETSHARLGPDARHAAGIPPGTVRLSVGLEHPDDLLADLEQAIQGGKPTQDLAPKTEPL